ncbi:MAG: hypothetical protein AB1403_25400 [Candidatus Riflebacteria bacterium]
MMEKKIDFRIKHREDIIDTLLLRAREKKVLLGLLIMLICTIVYENSEALSRFIWADNFKVPALGAPRPALVRPEMIKQLNRSLQKVEGQFPQFVGIFARFHETLNKAEADAATEQNRQKATYAFFMVSREIYRFAFNPVLPVSKEMTELQTALQQLQKKMKFDLKSPDELTPVSFVRAEEEQQVEIHRSLFEYENF